MQLAYRMFTDIDPKVSINYLIHIYNTNVSDLCASAKNKIGTPQIKTFWACTFRKKEMGLTIPSVFESCANEKQRVQLAPFQHYF